MERLQELRRFAEAGRVSAGLIHDMTSPLTAAILHLEQDGHNGMSSIRHARRSIKVLERYIEAARQQLSRQEQQPVVFCMKHELRQAKYILQPLARRRRTHLKFNIRTDRSSLLGDPVKFQRIIINLVTNAIDAYQEIRVDRPAVFVTARTEEKHVRLKVLDRGKGIETEHLPRLFEPFYTTKKLNDTGGLGIGLSTVKQYVEEDFGGIVTAASNKDDGTEFCVRLPLHADPET
jgi:signal transduction histidine kinase